MGRLFSLVLVTSIVVPFFAAAGQVDRERRQRFDAMLAAPHDTASSHMTCRPRSEACEDEGD